MKNKIYYHSSTIKRILLLIAIVLIFSLLFYTQRIVDDLREDSTKLMNFYAEIYTELVTSTSGDMSFVFEKVVQNITIPMVLSEKKDTLVTSFRNIGNEKQIYTSEDTLYALKNMRKMDQENAPIHLMYGDRTLGYIHYGDTELIGKLRMLPYIEIGVVALFIFLGYIGFQTIRSSEKSSIWAGMAKETAHQLGTPLSSLMGWTAVLESIYENDENIQEMKRDINRLEKVTNRFSKIGSEPVLIKTDIPEVITEAVVYYQKRLPQLGRKIQINYKSDEKLYCNINADIFSWAIENLIKNAIDAIGNKDGEVNIITNIEKDAKNIIIEVSDNGKGIEKKNWNNVFRPGYSTKRRGWGLGLSLTKRIIEQYHNGIIIVKNSKIGMGTTFRITIPFKKD